MSDHKPLAFVKASGEMQRNRDGDQQEAERIQNSRHHDYVRWEAEDKVQASEPSLGRAVGFIYDRKTRRPTIYFAA